jgi:hypothetical protein
MKTSEELVELLRQARSHVEYDAFGPKEGCDCRQCAAARLLIQIDEALKEGT